MTAESSVNQDNYYALVQVLVEEAKRTFTPYRYTVK